MKSITAPIIVSLSLMLTACGGGGDEGSGTVSTPEPIITDDQTVDQTDDQTDDQVVDGQAAAEAQLMALQALSNNTVLRNVDLSGATGLIITDSSGAATGQKIITTSRSNDPDNNKSSKASINFDGQFLPSTLYKITENGSLEEVNLTSADGDDIRGSIEPVSMTEMGNGWSIFSFKVRTAVIERSWSIVTLLDDETIDSVNSVPEYYLYNENNSFDYNHYLVENKTGIAYKADWAGQRNISSLGQDGFLDYNLVDRSTSPDRFIEAPGDRSIYDRQSAAAFDDQGIMYVVGTFGSIIDNFSNYYNRVLKINTNLVGADTLSAEVIQTVDLDSDIHPSVKVSSDGKILTYNVSDRQSGDQILRVMNLEANATYNVLSLGEINLLNRQPILGRDGDLYLLTNEFKEFESSLSSFYFEQVVVGKLVVEEGVNKPRFVRTAVLNQGTPSDTTNQYDELLITPTLTEWDSLEELWSQKPEMSEAPDDQEYEVYDTWVAAMEEFSGIANELWGNWSGATEIDDFVLNGKDIYAVMSYQGYDRVPEGFHEIDIVNARTRNVSLEELGFQQVEALSFNNDSFFLFGTGSNGLKRIARWTPGLIVETAPIALDTDTFDVQRFKVLNASTVIFEADVLNPWTDDNLTLSAGVKVLAEANFEGNVTIIDTIEAGEVVILAMERITQGDFLAVDGLAEDWPIDKRFITDTEDDNTNHEGGDLRYLSEYNDDDYIWYLVESKTNLNGARLIVNLNPTQSIVYQKGMAYWVDNKVEENLFSQLGVAAEGNNVVEFRVPTSLATGFSMGGTTVKTEIDLEFGGIESITTSFDNKAQSYTVDVNLSSPVGPAELTLALDDQYELRITDDNWNELMASTSDDIFDINLVDLSTELSSSLTSINGTFSVQANVVSITIPFNELSLPSAIYDDTTSIVDIVTDIDLTASSDTININDEYFLLVNVVSNAIDKVEIVKVDDDSTVIVDAVNYQESNGALSIKLDYAAITMTGETKPTIMLVDDTNQISTVVTSESQMVAVPVDM